MFQARIKKEIFGSVPIYRLEAAAKQWWGLIDVREDPPGIYLMSFDRYMPAESRTVFVGNCIADVLVKLNLIELVPDNR